MKKLRSFEWSDWFVVDDKYFPSLELLTFQPAADEDTVLLIFQLPSAVMQIHATNYTCPFSTSIAR